MNALSVVPARAWGDRRLTGRDLRALGAIASFARRGGGGVWAARATIAARARLDPRDYRRSLARLEALGYVARTTRRRPDGGCTTMLLAVLRDPASEVPEVAASAALEGRGILPPPGGETPPPPGGKLPPQSEQFIRAPDPFAARACATEAPPAGLGAAGERALRRCREALPPEALAAFGALCRASRSPGTLAIELVALADGLRGEAASWAALGLALQDLRLAGSRLTGAALRAFARRAEREITDRRSVASASRAVAEDRSRRAAEARAQSRQAAARAVPPDRVPSMRDLLAGTGLVPSVGSSGGATPSDRPAPAVQGPATGRSPAAPSQVTASGRSGAGEAVGRAVVTVAPYS